MAVERQKLEIWTHNVNFHESNTIQKTEQRPNLIRESLSSRLGY